jgi:para-aminobenzoate synthetase component 1
MGSMTGAPKRIVIEFIDEIETTARGWYSGSIGYIEPNGNFDLNVVIRSLLIDTETNKSSYTVGGAITFDSDPEAEFQECKLKAKALNKILGF